MYNSKRKLNFTVIEHKTTKKRRKSKNLNLPVVLESSPKYALAGGSTCESVRDLLFDKSCDNEKLTSGQVEKYLDREGVNTCDMFCDIVDGMSCAKFENISCDMGRIISQDGEGISPCQLDLEEHCYARPKEDSLLTVEPSAGVADHRVKEDIFIKDCPWMNDGGFNTIMSAADGLPICDVFIFSNKIISPQERENTLRSFAAKLYKLNSPSEEDVDLLFHKCCKKADTDPSKVNPEPIPEMLPAPKIARSTPGPRLPQLPSIMSYHTPDDSLRVLHHLHLSEDHARYVRNIGLLPLATEYGVRKRKWELMGGLQGKGWVVCKKYSLRRWFRTEKEEINHREKGGAARRDWIVGSVKPGCLAATVQHWANVLTDRGQYVSLGDQSDCPELLKEAVVIVTGNDAGQGRTREGIRFVNRPQANSGGKVFVTGMINRSDKGLSLGQKQHIFSQLKTLRNLTTINMGHKERRLIVISCMDYEGKW